MEFHFPESDHDDIPGYVLEFARRRGMELARAVEEQIRVLMACGYRLDELVRISRRDGSRPDEVWPRSMLRE